MHMDYMEEPEAINQIADFLFNRLENCSLDEAVTYFYEEFEMKEEVSLRLISDYLLTYRASKTYDLLH
jgi:hypothetical protein